MDTRVSPEIDLETAPIPIPNLHQKPIDFKAASDFFKSLPYSPEDLTTLQSTPSADLNLTPELTVAESPSTPPENVVSALRPPQKVRSVIPARRKLVKKMMYESILRFFDRAPPN